MREVARIIAERDASELWPEEERERLFALLSGMIFKDLVDLYGQIAGLGAPELPAETTYRDVFATLENLNADPDGLPKPIVFVEHLANGRRNASMRPPQLTFADAIRYFPIRRAHVTSILRTCLDFEDGVAQLVTAISSQESSGALPVNRLVVLLTDA